MAAAEGVRFACSRKPSVDLCRHDLSANNNFTVDAACHARSLLTITILTMGVHCAARPGLSDQPAAGAALTEWSTCGAIQVARRWRTGTSPCKAGLHRAASGA